MNDYQKLNNSVIQSLLSVLPDGWYSIGLSVKKDGTDHILTIFSPENYNQMVIIPDNMYADINAIAILLENHEKVWSEVLFIATFDEEIENWKFKVDYQYVE